MEHPMSTVQNGKQAGDEATGTGLMAKLLLIEDDKETAALFGGS